MYTGMLNDKGGMESDCTITRTDYDEYLIVTSTSQAVRDLDWLNKQLDNPSRAAGESPVEHAVAVDVTSAYSVLTLMGPRSRDVLRKCSTADLSIDAFPFGTSRLIDVGHSTIRASRITYVGELGWELYIPTEMATYVYQLLMSSGSEFGLTNAGYYTIDSLRMEKGYRAWGAELSSDWSPYECGLGFAVKLGKSVDFIGKRALLELKARTGSLTSPLVDSGLRKQLVCFSINNPDIYPWGSESILYNGRTVGYVTSAAYGHTVGKGVVFAMIRGEDCLQAVKNGSIENFEIDLNGVLYPIIPSLNNKALYDPNGVKIKL